MATRPARLRAPTRADVRMEMVARLGAAIALFVVVASFAYSYAQIRWVSLMLGAEPAWLSYLYPLIIDGPALVASGLTIALHDRQSLRQRAYGWTVLTVFVTISWAANAAHAVTHSRLPAIAGGAWWSYALVVAFAGFAPLGFVLGVHLWAYALRHSVAADQRITPDRADAPPKPRPQYAGAARPAEQSPRHARPAPARTTPAPAGAPAGATSTSTRAGSASQGDSYEPDEEQAYQQHYAAALDRGDSAPSGARVAKILGQSEGNGRKVRARWAARYRREQAARGAPDRDASKDAPVATAPANGHPDDRERARAAAET